MGSKDADSEYMPNYQKGDRVAAFHEMAYPGGSYAEYALGWDWTTFHIPESISFEGESDVRLSYGMTC